MAHRERSERDGRRLAYARRGRPRGVSYGFAPDGHIIIISEASLYVPRIPAFFEASGNEKARAESD